jgi:hypothetical protein
VRPNYREKEKKKKWNVKDGSKSLKNTTKLEKKYFNTGLSKTS